MSILSKLPEVTDLKPRISVVGVGGAGCNAINNMIASGLKAVDFISANTDAQALKASRADYCIQLGAKLTSGLGAGANPQIGQQAAEEAIDEIRSRISGSHMVFLAAGMGGGTGTGAVPIIAKTAKEMDILTVAIVSKPFSFEGTRRMRIADAGIEVLRHCVDTLIVIPNQNLFHLANEKTTFAESFIVADQILHSGVACIVDLIVKDGHINLDFADVKAVMKDMGTAVMGTGKASGQDRATKAAKAAISNPLLMDISLSGAQGLLISIVGGHDVTLFEVDEAANYIKKQVDPDANIIIGANFEETVEDFLQVSIVASGLPLAKSPKSDQKFDVQSSQLSHVGSAKKLSSGQGIDKAIGEDSEKKKTSSIVSTDVCYGSRSLNNEVQKKHIRPPALPHTILSTMSKDTQSDRSSSEEFARALSEVIGNRDGHIKKDIRLQKKMSNDTWRTADGVEFVDGFKPAFSTQHSPMKLTTSQLKSELTQDFSPRPPAEQPNRHPDVSEFPHIAQRVYQANTAQDESQLKNAVDMPNILKRLANLGKQLG